MPPSESINARKGIKTILPPFGACDCRSESINARKGIKTVSGVFFGSVGRIDVRINKCP